MNDRRDWTYQRLVDELPRDEEGELAVDETVDSIVPLLRAKHPMIVGAVLGQLVAMWLVGMRGEAVRDEARRTWNALLDDLIESLDEEENP